MDRDTRHPYRTSYVRAAPQRSASFPSDRVPGQPRAPSTRCKWSGVHLGPVPTVADRRRITKSDTSLIAHHARAVNVRGGRVAVTKSPCYAGRPAIRSARRHPRRVQVVHRTEATTAELEDDASTLERVRPFRPTIPSAHGAPVGRRLKKRSPQLRPIPEQICGLQLSGRLDLNQRPLAPQRCFPRTHRFPPAAPSRKGSEPRKHRNWLSAHRAHPPHRFSREMGRIWGAGRCR